MTRRSFLQVILKVGAAIAILSFAARWLAKKCNPRRFVEAIANKKYPGKVGPLPDITKQAKWSG